MPRCRNRPVDVGFDFLDFLPVPGVGVGIGPLLDHLHVERRLTLLRTPLHSPERPSKPNIP